MEQLPLYISFFFVATTLLTIALFYKATHHSKTVLVILTAWLLLQTIVGLSGFYTKTYSLPPRFLLLIVPPFLAIAALFLTHRGRRFLDGLDVRFLTLLHAVRIPVEIALFWLAAHKAVPQLMTFEGRNFDILSGLTALLVFYFGFVRKRLNTKVVLLWNFGCLTLLATIITTAILSAPSPFQKLAFEQPNVAIAYFPFVWLPCCIVPLVLLSHLASIRQLLARNGAPASALSKVQTSPISATSLDSRQPHRL